VERKTPPSDVPAKRLTPLTVNEMTFVLPSPSCAVVGRKKDAISRARKEICPREDKTPDTRVRQAAIYRRPAHPVVCGTKDAAVGPGKEKSPAGKKTIHGAPARSVGLHPLSGRKGTKQNDGECETDGLGSHLVLLSTQTR
jgi:hypothetical protein